MKYNKLLLILSLLAVMLVGCTNNTTSHEEDEKINVYTENDTIIINEFNQFETKLDNIISDNDLEIEDKAKGVFVLIVDFIFYEGEINGITFNELSDAGKEKVLKIATSIDNKINLKYPDYKNTIVSTAKQAFNKASELIKKGATNINDFSQDNFSNEYYNSIILVKENLIYYTKKASPIIGEVSQIFYQATKSSITTWYDLIKNR